MTPQDMVRLDFDVLACIAEFLPSHALVALMQTCRACYKAGLPLLCKLADTVPLTRIRQISSFTRFLRPELSVHSQQDSSQSRARKIQRLHLDITYFGGLSPQYILTDLKQCVNLRQLYLQLTPQYDTGCSNFCAIGRTMFYQAVSQWRSLEELELVLLPHEGVVEGLKCLNNLHQLSTLRFLFPSPCCARPRRLPPVLSVISTLPLSQRLRELDLCSEQDSQDVPDVCLPNVQTLGFCFNPNSTDITLLIRAFPGVVHLRLHTAQPAPSCIDLEPDFTRRNFINQWPTPPVDVWPSLQSVWVQSLNTLYAFAMPLQVRQISYQCIDRLFERYSFDGYMTTVLDAAQPEMVEVRVAIESKLERAAVTPEPHGRDNVDSKNLLRGLYRNASMRSLVVTFLNVATAEDLDDIVHRIQAVPHTVKNVLLNFTSRPGILAMKDDDMINTLYNVTYQAASRIARGSFTIQWIGVYVQEHHLRCWRVHREKSRACDPWQNPMAHLLAEREELGWATLRENHMDGCIGRPWSRYSH